MSDTLVLNRSYYAIHVLEWQRAISLLYTGHADALDDNLQAYDFDDWKELSASMESHPSGFVNSVNFKIAIPEVIRLKIYDKLPRTEVKFTRHNIYEHYEYKCCYCGKKLPTSRLNLDHVISRAKGGKTDWSNIVTACVPCNTKKGDRSPVEAGMKLLVTPTRPQWRGHKAIVRLPIKIKTSWQKLIDDRYWNTELQK